MGNPQRARGRDFQGPLSPSPLPYPGVYSIKAEWDLTETTCSDTESPLTVVRVTVAAGDSLVTLGETLPVTYTIEPDSVSIAAALEVRNQGDVLVYRRDYLDGTAGQHQTSWPLAWWNQQPHDGSYANPANSPYKVAVVGSIGGLSCHSNIENVDTELIIQADIHDPQPAGGTGCAGLDDLLDALKIVVQLGGADVTVFQGPGNISVQGEYNSKHIWLEDESLNSLPDGDYQVLFRDLRDAIGNFTDADGDPANGIQEIGFPLPLW